jgi:multidrug transporter EmrE-like cation transporter
VKWLILAFGIVAEIGSVTCMKLSEGFSNLKIASIILVVLGVTGLNIEEVIRQ